MVEKCVKSRATKKMALSVLKNMGGQIPADMIGEITHSVCEVIKNSKEIKKETIVGVFRAAAPMLEKTGEDFFDYLKEALEISANLKKQEFDIVARIVIDDKDLSTAEKLDMISKYKDEEQKRKHKDWLVQLGMWIFTAISGSVLYKVMVGDSAGGTVGKINARIGNRKAKTGAIKALNRSKK